MPSPTAAWGSEGVALHGMGNVMASPYCEAANRRTLPHAAMGERSHRIRRAWTLAADAEALDQRLVARLVLALDIVEQAAALADHLQQATAGVVVRLVGLKVLGQV